VTSLSRCVETKVGAVQPAISGGQAEHSKCQPDLIYTLEKTHKRTHTHGNRDLQTQTRTGTLAQTDTHTHTHTHTHTGTHTHTYTQTCKYTHTHTGEHKVHNCVFYLQRHVSKLLVYFKYQAEDARLRIRSEVRSTYSRLQYLLVIITYSGERGLRVARSTRSEKGNMRHMLLLGGASHSN
jgi:hypothetical protein